MLASADVGPPSEDDELSAAVVGAWRADAEIDRRRSRRLARQLLDDELDLVATLVNRAESGRPVSLDLLGGQRHTGHLWWVGAAAAGLRAAGAADVLVALGAVAVLRDAPGREVPPAINAAPPTPRTSRSLGSGSLIEALSSLAYDEPDVTVFGRTGGSPIAMGSLGAVGRDAFVVLEPDGHRAVVTAHSVGWLRLDP